MGFLFFSPLTSPPHTNRNTSLLGRIRSSSCALFVLRSIWLLSHFCLLPVTVFPVFSLRQQRNREPMPKAVWMGCQEHPESLDCDSSSPPEAKRGFRADPFGHRPRVLYATQISKVFVMLVSERDVGGSKSAIVVGQNRLELG